MDPLSSQKNSSVDKMEPKKKNTKVFKWVTDIAETAAKTNNNQSIKNKNISIKHNSHQIYNV